MSIRGVGNACTCIGTPVLEVVLDIGIIVSSIFDIGLYIGNIYSPVVDIRFYIGNIGSTVLDTGNIG